MSWHLRHTASIEKGGATLLVSVQGYEQVLIGTDPAR
jgi:hypothetical protein